MVLLGEVDELEVVREGTDDALGHPGVHRAHDLGELATRFSCIAPPCTARFGESTDLLLQLEQLRAFLLHECVSQHTPEIRDVSTEGIERVGHGMQGSLNGVTLARLAFGAFRVGPFWGGAKNPLRLSDVRRYVTAECACYDSEITQPRVDTRDGLQDVRRIAARGSS